jgi:uncharacterized protein with FMN-binding domain
MATKKKGQSKRIATSLVTLGSAVITTIYAAGYVRTQSAADQAAAQEVPAAVVRPADTATLEPGIVYTPTVVPPPPVPPSPTTGAASPTSAATAFLAQRASRGGTASITPSPTATPTLPATPAKSAASGYRDGTFVGLGHSRHGNVQATVVVNGGKIVSADITGCSTRYPCSWIDPLPGQVVSQQNTQVDFVSGATDSSMAYQSAVEQALAKAKAS